MRKAASLAAESRRLRLFFSGFLPFSCSSQLRMAAPACVDGGGIPLFRGSSKAHPASLSTFSFAFSIKPFFDSRPLSAFSDPPAGETEMEMVEDSDFEWEEEEETDPVVGDGGDGGGIVLGDVKWGEHALSLVHQVLRSFGDDMALYAFKISPKGYIYVRLDKLTNKFGCPAIEEIDSFSDLYKKRLDEAGVAGELPSDLALEVSSPGAERLLRVPQDLDRFREMSMWVYYLEENQDTKQQQQQQTEKVLMLESIDTDAELCVFMLADVKENRGELGKGRPMSRKQRNWRLNLPFKSITKMKLYLRF